MEDYDSAQGTRSSALVGPTVVPLPRPRLSRNREFAFAIGIPKGEQAGCIRLEDLQLIPNLKQPGKQMKTSADSIRCWEADVKAPKRASPLA